MKSRISVWWSVSPLAVSRQARLNRPPEIIQHRYTSRSGKAPQFLAIGARSERIRRAALVEAPAPWWWTGGPPTGLPGGIGIAHRPRKIPDVQMGSIFPKRGTDKSADCGTEVPTGSFPASQHRGGLSPGEELRPLRKQLLGVCARCFRAVSGSAWNDEKTSRFLQWGILETLRLL